VSPTVSGDDLKLLFEDKDFLACCARIKEGYNESWFGDNLVGEFDKAAQSAIEEANEIILWKCEHGKIVDAPENADDIEGFCEIWPGGGSLEDAAAKLEKENQDQERIFGMECHALLKRAYYLFYNGPGCLAKTHVDALLKYGKIKEFLGEKWMRDHYANADESKAA
jgi:hypothetical protein